MAEGSTAEGGGSQPVRPRRKRRRKPDTYPDVFSLVLAQMPDLGYVGERPGVERKGFDCLSGSVVVVLDCEAAALDGLVAEWPDQDNARELVKGLHGLELERAAQPPEVHVTITPPGGQQAVPGHFVVSTGPDKQISYVDAPDQAAGTGTAPVVDVTPKLRRRRRLGVAEAE
jgi:hypothetical protein